MRLTYEPLAPGFIQFFDRAKGQYLDAWYFAGRVRVPPQGPWTRPLHVLSSLLHDVDAGWCGLVLESLRQAARVQLQRDRCSASVLADYQLLHFTYLCAYPCVLHVYGCKLFPDLFSVTGCRLRSVAYFTLPTVGSGFSSLMKGWTPGSARSSSTKN